MNKHYFNPRKKRKDPGVENEKRRLNNKSVEKSINRRFNKEHNN